MINKKISTIAMFTLCVCIILAASCGNMLTEALDDSSYDYYLYTANFSSEDITVFKINTDGTLVYENRADVISQPYSLLASPVDNQLFVLSNFSSNVLRFKVLYDGSLFLLSGIGIGTSPCNPQSFAINRLGEMMYAMNFEQSTFHYYTLNPDGSMTRQASTYSTAGKPSMCKLHPDGIALYVGCESPTNIMMYFPVNADGSLGASISYGFTGVREPVIHPEKKYLYSPRYLQNKIGRFIINTDGSLATVDPEEDTETSNPVSNSFPGFMCFDRTGGFLYAPIFDATFSTHIIDAFRWNMDGSLSLIGSYQTEAGPYSVEVHPDQDVLYCLNYGVNSITAYTILSDGSLQQLGEPVSTNGSFSRRMAIVKVSRSEK